MINTFDEISEEKLSRLRSHYSNRKVPWIPCAVAAWNSLCCLNVNHTAHISLVILIEIINHCYESEHFSSVLRNLLCLSSAVRQKQSVIAVRVERVGSVIFRLSTTKDGADRKSVGNKSAENPFDLIDSQIPDIGVIVMSQHHKYSGWCNPSTGPVCRISHRKWR